LEGCGEVDGLIHALECLAGEVEGDAALEGPVGAQAHGGLVLPRAAVCVNELAAWPEGARARVADGVAELGVDGAQVVPCVIHPRGRAEFVEAQV
jgi:hypothetical protein